MEPQERQEQVPLVLPAQLVLRAPQGRREPLAQAPRVRPVPLEPQVPPEQPGPRERALPGLRVHRAFRVLTVLMDAQEALAQLALKVQRDLVLREPRVRSESPALLEQGQRVQLVRLAPLVRTALLALRVPMGCKDHPVFMETTAPLEQPARVLPVLRV